MLGLIFFFFWEFIHPDAPSTREAVLHPYMRWFVNKYLLDTEFYVRLLDYIKQINKNSSYSSLIVLPLCSSNPMVSFNY